MVSRNAQTFVGLAVGVFLAASAIAHDGDLDQGRGVADESLMCRIGSWTHTFQQQPLTFAA